MHHILDNEHFDGGVPALNNVAQMVVILDDVEEWCEEG